MKIKEHRRHAPNVAFTRGATESHGGHLPYTTDVIEAEAFANRAGGDIRYSWRSRG
jgi:creatinine amidohydrolase/Fe(II)-dependent formamide hydrolase-like protein